MRSSPLRWAATIGAIQIPALHSRPERRIEGDADHRIEGSGASDEYCRAVRERRTVAFSPKLPYGSS
jgi:hypothetical protein